MATSLDAWIHNFTVTDCCTHQNGYTIYKITSIVFPAYIPEALTCVSVWKRFNEIKKLRKAINKRYKELHLNGVVPDMKEDRFFKRFEPEVIQERKEFILKLLDFIAQHPSLYKAQAFVNFFEASHTPNITPRRLSNIESICIDIDVPFNQEYNLIDPFKEEDETPQSSSKTNSILSDNNSSTSELFTPVTEPNEEVFVEPSIISVRPEEITVKTQPTEQPEPIGTNDTIDNVDYIYEAALEFSEAVRSEVNLNYRDAFERYKSGINKLIIGAKFDIKEDRKRIAKDKTQKYLTRAEQIYEKHIVNGCIENENQIDVAQNNINFNSYDDVSIEKPINQLSKFKVIKILETVMQVQDVTNKHIYIMKAIEKPSSNNLPQTIQLPQAVPFVVPLISYLQSETKIYLLLQQANGGKLWDYIRSYEPSISTMSNRTASLASLFSEPFESKSLKIENVPKEVLLSSPFMETLNNYKNSVGIYTTNNVGLSETIEQLESGADIPAFDILSQDMEVIDLVNCSQKLLKSVSNTLENFKTINNNGSFNLTDRLQDIKTEPVTSSNIIKNTITVTPKKVTKINVNNVINIPERSIRRWASEIVTSLVCLHSRGIVCMDLHADNILLGSNGQVQLTYFYQQECASNQSQRQLSSKAIDALYVAPERPLTKQSDWWSFGVILFELLTGSLYVSCHPGGVSSYYDVQYPEVELSEESKELLEGLLEVNPDVRFGEKEVKNHRFFEHINWNEIIRENICSTRTYFIECD